MPQRCSGKTKDGYKCSRTIVGHNKRCWQHGGAKTPADSPERFQVSRVHGIVKKFQKGSLSFEKLSLLTTAIRNNTDVLAKISKLDDEQLEEFIKNSDMEKDIKKIITPDLFFNYKARTKYGDVLYRFATKKEFIMKNILKEVPCYKYDDPYISTEDNYTNNKKDFLDNKNKTTNVTNGIYQVTSSSGGKKIISVGTYLSPTHGVNGHITGFFRYEDWTKKMYNFTHLYDGWLIFKKIQEIQRDKRYCVFTLKDLVLNNKHANYKVTDQPLISKSDEDHLKTIIPIQKGILWYGSLGSLMTHPHTNTAEINFVGDVDFPIFVIESDDIDCIKTVLSAAYHGHFDDVITKMLQ